MKRIVAKKKPLSGSTQDVAGKIGTIADVIFSGSSGQ
jgi:hypothetical protein